MVADVEVLEDELAGWMVWPEEPMHEDKQACRVVGVIALPGDPVNHLGTLLYSLGATCYTAAFVRGATGHRSLVWGVLGVSASGSVPASKAALRRGRPCCAS